jgi:hypothetical protein
MAKQRPDSPRSPELNPLKNIHKKPAGKTPKPSSWRKFSLGTVRDVLEEMGLDPMKEIVKVIQKPGAVDEDTRLAALQSILRYTYPTLSAVTMDLDAKVKSYAVSDAPLTDEEWAEQHGNNLETSTGTAEGFS